MGDEKPVDFQTANSARDEFLRIMIKSIARDKFYSEETGNSNARDEF